MRLLIFEDGGVGRLAPLTLTRPAFDLRSGAGTLAERQARYAGAAEVGFLVRPILKDLTRVRRPDAAVNDPDFARGKPVALVNARWVPPEEGALPAGVDAIGFAGEQLAWVVRRECEAGPSRPEELHEQLARWTRELPPFDAGGWMADYPWQLVEHNGDSLEQDARWWRAEQRPVGVPAGAIVLGDPNRVLVHRQAKVEPHAVFDATRGPILVDADAVVQAFSRLEGPCYVGPRTQLLAGRVRGGSIGPECRIGGEVEASILQGHTNKYHDGFLGHSYVGEWVNIGAGTQFSDLRNDYSNLQVYAGGQMIDTGLIKIGTYLGDYTRTSINTSVNAGTVVGPFCQLLTSGGLLPRVFPPFTVINRGRVEERNDLRRMFQTAAMAMGRRGQLWTPSHEEFYLSLYDETAEERWRLLREGEQCRLRRQMV
jgi:UDP-N-acetylglucosamine diphosphorylase/glucosamine-1-phosphate N-acetyltransferase